MTFDEIVEELLDFDDPLEKLRFIVELGQAADELPLGERIEPNRIRGCVSNAWLVCAWSNAELPRLTVRFDADAVIVKGLLALIAEALRDKTASEVADTDFNALLERLGLSSALTPSRKNGLAAALSVIRAEANALAEARQ